MLNEFEMSDLGKLNYFGIKFVETEKGIVMHQSRYAKEMLKKAEMQNCKAANTPAEVGLRLEIDPEEEAVDASLYCSMVGSLRCLCKTRPDVSFSVGLVTCEATCQAIWLKSVMKGLKIDLTKKIQLCIDNKYAIDLAKHPASHGRSKHIETKFHYIREQVKDEKLELCYCRSEMQLANILTKALKFERFKSLRKLIGVAGTI
ncbi:uncharacterized protein LOC124833339 [Vigna umbellata]|uniref:uncharacterized protein LOC124833339 n=1 Tax=Vigna umbellata TaxID=87088 RepID=UPI001F5F8D70|nr:uncharacterized protein LOC124833339 [Vigna umbellata]